MMKNIKLHSAADKSDANFQSKQHLAMRFFGRLIHSHSLNEATLLVKNAFDIFKSETVTEEVHASVEQIEEAINTFSNDIDEYITDEHANYSSTEEDRTTDTICKNENEEEMLQARSSEIPRHWESALGPLTNG